MKKLLILSCLLFGFSVLASCSSSKKSNLYKMLAIRQVDTPIPGVCDNSRVIAILPISGNGQIEAKAPLSDLEIAQELNAKVSFLRGKTDYNDKGMVNLIINCKGKMVQCEIDNKTQSPELDKQIVAVFAALKDWKPAIAYGEAVDASVLYSFKINNGIISL